MPVIPMSARRFVLGRQREIFGKTAGDVLRFEEKAGIVEAELKRDTHGQVIGAAISAPESLLLGPQIDVENHCALCLDRG